MDCAWARSAPTAASSPTRCHGPQLGAVDRRSISGSRPPHLTARNEHHGAEDLTIRHVQTTLRDGPTINKRRAIGGGRQLHVERRQRQALATQPHMRGHTCPRHPVVIPRSGVLSAAMWGPPSAAAACRWRPAAQRARQPRRRPWRRSERVWAIKAYSSAPEYDKLRTNRYRQMLRCFCMGQPEGSEGTSI